MSETDDVASMSFERALAELDTLIARLEGGAVQLDEAIACYQRGSRLVERCSELLDRTEQSVTQLVVGRGGSQERPFSPEAVPAEEASPPRRARSVAPQGSPGRPALLPGLGPDPEAARPERRPPVDPDDIPF